LDIFSKNNDITSIDVLKVDVQGFEGPVFRGARKTLPHIKQLFIESTWMDIESIMEIIPLGLTYGFTHAAVINPVYMGADILLSRRKFCSSNIHLSFELTEDLLAKR
jgi:Methyltransferase FkbM domain